TVERRDNLVASGKTLRSHDIGQLAVFVLDQGDPGGAVRIVFETFNRPDNVELDALEVDHAVAALVTTTTMIGSDTAGIVTAAALAKAFGQSLDRSALPQFRTVSRNQGTTAFGGG